MYGKTLVSRMGLSLLKSLNMEHNATSKYSDYEDAVLNLLSNNILFKAGSVNLAARNTFEINYN
jgi:hypothetical protein